MASRGMGGVGLVLLLTIFAHGQEQRNEAARTAVIPVGYLVPTASTTNGSQGESLPYQPRPGDIVLYDDFNKFFHLVFKLAKTSAPTHVAIVIAGPDGKPALLDLTGPKVITAKVVVVDVEKRFQAYPGMIMVRRIREPLTSDQSHELTQFAQTQSGKSFALGRVILQATPFCPRTGLRRELFGRTYLSRQRWYCSEMVVAAGAAAHLYDSKSVSANAVYPRDLAFDETLDLSSLYHPPVLWSAR